MLFVSLNPNDAEELDRLLTLSSILLRFHSPNCHHCTSMAPEWSALENHPKLKDKEISVIDADHSLAGKIKHKCGKDMADKGVPTIYFIKGDKFIEHGGERTADAMASFATSEMSKGSSKKRMIGGKKRRTHKKSKMEKARGEAKKQYCGRYLTGKYGVNKKGCKKDEKCVYSDMGSGGEWCWKKKRKYSKKIAKNQKKTRRVRRIRRIFGSLRKKHRKSNRPTRRRKKTHQQRKTRHRQLN